MFEYDSPWGSSHQFEARLAARRAVGRRLRELQDAVRETRAAWVELQLELDAAVEGEADAPGYLADWVEAAHAAYVRLLADLHAYRSEFVA